MDVPEGKRRHNTVFCPKCIPLTIHEFKAKNDCESLAFGNLILYLQHSKFIPLPIATLIQRCIQVFRARQANYFEHAKTLKLNIESVHQKELKTINRAAIYSQI